MQIQRMSSFTSKWLFTNSCDRRSKSSGCDGGLTGPNIVDRIGEAVPEEMAPSAIDHRLGDVGPVTARHQPGQLFAAIDTASWIDFLVKKDRISDLHLAAAFFEEHGTGEIGADEFGVIGHAPTGRAIRDSDARLAAFDAESC